MARRVKSAAKPLVKDREFAKMSPLEREDCLIRMAEDVAFQQLRDGTASSQVITQYLKLGSSRERIEQRNKELEGELLEAKTEQVRAAQRNEEMLEEAINAFKTYAGAL